MNKKVDTPFLKINQKEKFICGAFIFILYLSIFLVLLHISPEVRKMLDVIFRIIVIGICVVFLIIFCEKTQKRSN